LSGVNFMGSRKILRRRGAAGAAGK
jgi:hypothetical protein